MQTVELELLTSENLDAVRALRREDIPEDWVDDIDTLWEYTCEGLASGFAGHTYAIRYRGQYVGAILLGEAIPWATDPPQMRGVSFYRLMDFVLDKHFRRQGIGGAALEKCIAEIYREYGARPIACGVHRDNAGAARFYRRHGFRETDAMDATDGEDWYYLRFQGNR